MAREFVSYVLERHPNAEWPALYDAMCRTAQQRQFRGMGYDDLLRVGISFGLFSLDEVERLVLEVRGVRSN